MIINKLRSKQIEFMKAKDTLRLGILRYFLSEVQKKEIALRPQNEELTDKHVWKTLSKLIKQRNEGIELAKKSEREDVVEKENAELAILEEFAELFPEDMKKPNIPPHILEKMKVQGKLA